MGHRFPTDGPPPSPNGPSSRPDRPWAARYAFLTAWLAPAATGRRMSGVKLPAAYGVHLASALATIVLVTWLVAWEESGMSWNGEGVLSEFIELFEDAANETARHPGIVTLVVLVTAAVIELGFLGMALLVAPWGARDEPLRVTLGHALRFTWLHSAIAIPAVAIVGSLLVWLDHIGSAQYRWPGPRAGGVIDWQAAWQNHLRSLPWYTRYNDELMFVATIAGAAWVLWTLLRIAGARPGPPPLARPLQCEDCGYDLRGIPMDGLCPECGLDVRASIGPQNRLGTAWARRREVGGWRAWAQCLRLAIVDPKRLGREAPVVNPGTHHRRYLLLYMPIVFAVGSAGTIACAYADHPSWTPPAVELVMMVLAAGLLSVSIAVVLTLAAASFAGIWHRVRSKRNLMSVSMQIACYLIVPLTAWAVLLFGSIALVFVWEDLFREWRDVFGMHREELMGLAAGIPNAMCLVWYVVWVTRGTGAARFANR